MMRQAVEERGRELLVASEDGDPFRKFEVRRHDGGTAFVPVGDQIEEQLAADAIERDEAELVDDQHLDAAQPLLQPGQLAGIAGLVQQTHEVGGPGKEHPALLLGGLDAQGDRLARADRAGEDQILGPP